MRHNDNPSKANVEGLGKFDADIARSDKFNAASFFDRKAREYIKRESSIW